MMPTLKTSAVGPASRPSMISGAMCAGEPTSVPVTVIRSSMSISRAMPKSMSLRTPSSRTMTFSGLRSRWMTPASCACASAAASSWMTMAASSGGSMGPSSRNVFSVWPRMYSVTMNASWASAAEKSKTSRMLGWCSLATARASRASRRRDSSLPARCGCSTFTAKRCPVGRYSARYTVPSAPAPSQRRKTSGPCRCPSRQLADTATPSCTAGHAAPAGWSTSHRMQAIPHHPLPPRSGAGGGGLATGVQRTLVRSWTEQAPRWPRSPVNQGLAAGNSSRGGAGRFSSAPAPTWAPTGTSSACAP